MELVLLLVAVAVFTIFYQRQRPRSPTYAVDEPVTSETLRAIPSHLRGHLVEVDIVVRDYLKFDRNGSSLGDPFRPRSELPHSVAATKNSLILVAAFRAGRAGNPQEVLRQLREAYSALAFFPPTAAEAEEEWENSAKDDDAMQEAARARSPQTKSLAGAMKESGRLISEFDEEVLAFASPAGN